MATPRVTVGLPVFNGERYLAEAIESILGQNFADFELVIADNGSTDGTSEICARYASLDPRVSVHRSSVNMGAAWNYNRLVDLARGEYFKWVAHDDLLAPSMLCRCVEMLDAHDNAALAYPGVEEIDEHGSALRVYAFPAAYADHGSALERVSAVVARHTMCYEVFGLLRTRTLRATSRIGSYWGSDRALLVELAAVGRFVRVPEILLFSREHPERMRYSTDWTAWHDTRNAGMPTLPTWRLLREFGRVAMATPGSSLERARTARVLARWTFRRRRFLVRQLLLWAAYRSFVGRHLMRKRVSSSRRSRNSYAPRSLTGA